MSLLSLSSPRLVVLCHPLPPFKEVRGNYLEMHNYLDTVLHV